MIKFNTKFNLSFSGNDFSILQEVSVEKDGPDVLPATENVLRKEEEIEIQNRIRCTTGKFFSFCLRPSAKDLGITRVVVVLVLFHVSHFLIKRNLSEKNSSSERNQIGVLQHPSQVLYQLSYNNIGTYAWKVIFLTLE